MRYLASLLVLGLLFTACSQEEPIPPATYSNSPNTPTGPTPPNPPPTGTQSLAFDGITFTVDNPFFSTTSGMTQPVDLATAQGMAGQIDITYIYNWDYWQPGFLAPRTRASEWYWNEYNEPWLATADSTEWYGTDLTADDFNAARSNYGLIAGYFSDPDMVYLAPHAIFPTGTCVGGRQTSNPTSITLFEQQVIGFKNHDTGKRGLIYIRTDQAQFWPDAILTEATKVDIICEP